MYVYVSFDTQCFFIHAINNAKYNGLEEKMDSFLWPRAYSMLMNVCMYGVGVHCRWILR